MDLWDKTVIMLCFDLFGEPQLISNRKSMSYMFDA